MPKPIKRALLVTLGWIFVVLGVLGIFLPILQGILFLVIGFLLLSRESEWVQEKLEDAKRRWPKFGEKFDAAEAAANRLWRRLTGNGLTDNGSKAGDGA
jgi:uncharacterized membrane protein YbaN (DUF454 family)